MNDTAVWAANGGFEMSAERARELAWIATGGQTGVIGPGSLRVRATATPGPNVRIFPGAFAAQATPGSGMGYTSAPWQSYMRAVYQTLTVPIRATNSSGARTDVIGIIIDDPQYEGTSGSVNWGTHKFFRPHVVENAPNSTRPEHFANLGRPFVPLARIRIPSNTATITNSMIEDLRFLAVRREWAAPPLVTSVSTGLVRQNNETGWVDLDAIGEIDVPQWATSVKIDGEIVGAAHMSGWVRGEALLRFSAAAQTQSSPALPWRSPDDTSRFQIPIAGQMTLADVSRGAPAVMRFRVRVLGGTGRLQFNVGSTYYRLRLTFEEAPTIDLTGA